MFPPKHLDMFPPEGGCSEGLDAFRFFLNYYLCFLGLSTLSYIINYADFHIVVHRECFIKAASRLIRDMNTQYDLKLQRCKLFNFQSSLWRTSRVLFSPTSERTRRMFCHKLTLEIYFIAGCSGICRFLLG